MRGTTRRAQSTEALLKGPYGEYADAGRIEIFEVPDITVAGAFDDASKGLWDCQNLLIWNHVLRFSRC